MLHNILVSGRFAQNSTKSFFKIFQWVHQCFLYDRWIFDKFLKDFERSDHIKEMFSSDLENFGATNLQNLTNLGGKQVEVVLAETVADVADLEV